MTIDCNETEHSPVLEKRHVEECADASQINERAGAGMAGLEYLLVHQIWNMDGALCFKDSSLVDPQAHLSEDLSL